MVSDGRVLQCFGISGHGAFEMRSVVVNRLNIATEGNIAKHTS